MMSPPAKSGGGLWGTGSGSGGTNSGCCVMFFAIIGIGLGIGTTILLCI